jgi:DNA-directed RNA polymerase subunit RPC12/RpoP
VIVEDINIFGKAMTKHTEKEMFYCPVCGSKEIIKAKLPSDVNISDSKLLVNLVVISGLAGVLDVPENALKHYESRLGNIKFKRRLKAITVCSKCLSPNIVKIGRMTLCRSCMGRGQVKLFIDERVLDFFKKVGLTKLVKVYGYLKQLGLAKLEVDEQIDRSLERLYKAKDDVKKGIDAVAERVTCRLE